ncbi:HNH endonuclease [Streptomyces sp. RTd22]|uniref:HNH endonuclease signature motif containing protein n=1 Tax=Streptomyces sp. RTd22 TaxID=1841249 RepID=UPI0007C5D0F2|nr:HNH endonuclease [Streptomyces sp. RTd22]
MSDRHQYPRDVLARAAAASTSLVDMMRRLAMPLGSGPRRYLRTRLRHYGIDTSHFVEEPLPPRKPFAYTREILEEAAARSHGIREMLDHLGVPPYDSAYGHLRRKLAQFGIDTSHFTHRHGQAPIPQGDLLKAVTESCSLAGVLRALGRSNGGAGRAFVRRSIHEHGISTAHFVGQGHQRGKRSPHRKSAADILQRGEPGSPRQKTALLRRALDETGVPRVCVACGIGDSWQGRRLILEIDHINGDRLDDRIGNLRYLCPSCHSQTETFSVRARRPSATWRQGIDTQ